MDGGNGVEGYGVLTLSAWMGSLRRFEAILMVAHRRSILYAFESELQKLERFWCFCWDKPLRDVSCLFVCSGVW